MYCNSCGNAITDNSRVCSHCGTLVRMTATPKRLTRSRTDKKIAGICAGLAHYFDMDVTVVRIVCIFITLATGICPGIATYLLAWIIVPAEPQPQPLLAAHQPAAS
jgi:phage shock protein C